MIREHESIVLTADLPDDGIKAGAVGAVVHIYPKHAAYEVEFFSPAGNTIAVTYVERSQVRPTAPGEIEPLTVDYNYVDKDGIAVLTLNNPQRRNALSARTLAALEERLDEIARNPEARVVVINSNGPVFSSGHDLNELLNGDADDYAAVFDACTRVMESIRLLPQPVIAQVQGLATAAGCQLVATCDIAVAADTAAFATPGVQIGLFCTTPGVAVARSVMPKKALEMLLTGRPISAQEALDFGLISRIAPADALETQTMELARQIASASAHTLALGKAAFYRQIEMTRPDAYRFASGVMVDNLMAADAKEGISAFLEKRPPVWTT